MTVDLVELSDRIEEYFNENELKDLCFRLKVNYENLAGDAHREKVRELVMFCRRHGRLPDLTALCEELRSHVEWDQSEPETPPFGPVGDSSASFPQTWTPQNQAPGMFWMAQPNFWYGPFHGYYIMWFAMGGFQVWHPYYGIIPYPDPYRQIARNIWLRLPNSPFNVFVDGSPAGYVYAQYSP